MPLARGDPALLPAGGPRGNPREQAAGPPRAPIHLGAKRGRPAATTSGAKPQPDDLRSNLGAVHRAAPTGRRTSARAFGNMVACATPAGGAPLRENMLSLPIPSRAARRARKGNRAVPRSGNARPPAGHRAGNCDAACKPLGYAITWNTYCRSTPGRHHPVLIHVFRVCVCQRPPRSVSAPRWSIATQTQGIVGAIHACLASAFLTTTAIVKP